MAHKHVLKYQAIITYFTDEPKLISKGENAVESGDVVKMIFDDKLKIIKGEVHASMRDKLYKIQVNLNDDYFIESSECTCPRGQFYCHNIAVLAIFAHYTISSTDKACSWSVPKQLKDDKVKRINDIYPRNKPFRASKSNIAENAIETFKEQLSSFGGVVAFTWLLQPDLPTNDKLINDVSEIIFDEKFKNNQKTAYFKEIMKLSPEAIIKIAEEIKGQANNPKWLVCRKLRLTASNFGLVLGCCKRQKYTPSLFKTLMVLGSYDLDGVRAIEWGKQHEEDAVKQFSKDMELKVVQTGSWFHPCGYLVASPDGFVGDDAILEIKCPFKIRKEDLNESLKYERNYIIKFNSDKNEFEIDDNHNYYHQIQGLLHITN